MTIGNWEPNAPKTPLTMKHITAALEFSSAETFPTNPPEQLKPLQPFANSLHSEWVQILSEPSTEQLKQLCRFFTLAEANWTNWSGGDKNPVIWICKELKTRGAFPDRELTAWIKDHTDNRFLPYGNVFG